MSLWLPLLILFLLVNGFAYMALRRTVSHWVRDELRRRRAMLGLHLGFLLLNLPLLAFFIQRLNLALLHVPTGVLEIVFYPSTAWLATIIAFLLLAGPLALLRGLAKGVQMLWRWRNSATAPSAAAGETELSRRGFLASSAGLFVPAIYAVAAYGTYGNLDDLDISIERTIPMPHLPRSLDGLSIVQISDLHVGSYIRDKELRGIVSMVNSLRPDLVVITGDILDWYLSSLPDAVSGLTGIQSSLGTFAVLGNHDIFADQYSFTKEHRGGVEIAKGMQIIGVPPLPN